MAARTGNTTDANTAKADTKKATAVAATTTRARSAVSQDGTAKCGSCKKPLPVTKFPTTRTKDGEYVRSTGECRACRDARRAAAKEARNQSTTAA